MKIRKFVTINIILSIFLVSSLYGLSWFYINYVNDRTVKFMEYNKLPDNSVDIVSLGSSHGKYGLNLWEKNQMNLGLEQQGFYYGLKLLEKYESKIKKGAIVIIPISIFSFNEGNDFSKDETYKNYINLLEKKDIRRELKESEYILTRKFSVIYPPSRLLETIKYFKENRNLKKNMLKYGDNVRGEALKTEAKKADSHINGFKEENTRNGINRLVEILNYSKEKEYIPILCIIPTYYLYNIELEKVDKNIFYSGINKNIQIVEKILKKEYIFLDYSHDKRFENNVEYFMDDDHLNRKGAEYFTEILLNDINERLKNEERAL